jgi:hypothetical protein
MIQDLEIRVVKLEAKVETMGTDIDSVKTVVLDVQSQLASITAVLQQIKHIAIGALLFAGASQFGIDKLIGFLL